MYRPAFPSVLRCGIAVCLLFVGISGCGSADHAVLYESRDAQPAVDAPASGDVGGGFPSASGGENTEHEVGDGIEPMKRQIIHRATLQLVVGDFTGVAEKVEDLTRDHGGFVANSTLQGTTGTPRSGNWTIRIPTDSYGTFLDEAKQLGEFKSLTTESQEVTAEYYDVQSRIRNRKKSEERLLELLDESTGKLEDIVSLEEHLSKVREEIERLEGRLRLLKDLTAFTTVTLSITEVQGYQPAQVATLGERISRSWNNSVASLSSAGKDALVGLVALAPWLLAFGVPLLVLILVLRGYRRRCAE